MSIDVMCAVWRASEPRGSERMLLVAMADWASEDGSNVYPSIPLLARKCALGEREIQKLLRKLEEDKFIITHIKTHYNPKTGQYTNDYEINLAKLREYEYSYYVVNSATPEVVNCSSPGVVNCTTPPDARGELHDTGVVNSTTPGVVNYSSPNTLDSTLINTVVSSVEVPVEKESPLVLGSESDKGSLTPPRRARKHKSESPVLPDAPDFKALFSEVALALDLEVAPNAALIGKYASELRGYGYTAEQVNRFSRWWYLNDWRGKQNQPPTFKQLKETWKSAMAGRKYTDPPKPKSTVDDVTNIATYKASYAHY